MFKISTTLLLIIFIQTLLFAQKESVIAITDNCFPASTKFSIRLTADSVQWNFGENSSDANTAEGTTAEHQYQSSGTYTVKVKYYIDDSLHTGETKINITDYPELDEVPDADICEGESTMRSVYALNNINYSWSNGATGNIAILSTTGAHWVQAENKGCISRQSFEIKAQACNSVIPQTVTFEKNRELVLWAPYADSYKWSTGAETQGITIAKPQNGDSYQAVLNKQSHSPILNASFDKGSAGFSSGLSFQKENIGENSYAVQANASKLSENIIKKAFDHTSGNGASGFLTASFSGTEKKIWSETVSVFQEKKYRLGFWVRNIGIANSDPRLTIKINGETIALNADASGYNQWTELSYEWNSANNTSALIEISSAGSEGIIGLDDINFSFDINKTYQYTLQESTKNCVAVSADNLVFDKPNTSVTLVANTASSCTKLEWHSSDLFSSDIVGTSCSFTTPNLSESTSFWINDKSDDGRYAKTTGYSFHDPDLSNPVDDWAHAQSTTFIVKTDIVLQSVDILITDCNNQSGPMTLNLTDNKTKSTISFSQYINCSDNGIIRLNPQFELKEGIEYKLSIDKASQIKARVYNIDRYAMEDHFDQEIEIVQSGPGGTRGFGPFFNWRLTGECPWTEVKALMKKAEICGDGIDNDGDGDVDEACSAFACNATTYQTMNTALFKVNTQNISLQRQIDFNFFINAAGFNPVDNTIYVQAMDGANKHQLIRIDANNKTEKLGYIIKPDGSVLKSFAADFDILGTFYCIEQDDSGGTLYAVDIATMTAKAVLDCPAFMADVAVNPINQLIYGLGNDKTLFEMDPTAGAINAVGNISDYNETGPVNALHFHPSGDLLAYGAFTNNSNTNDFVRIKIETLEANLLANNKKYIENADGCSCPYSLAFEKTASVEKAGSGDTFSYTLTVYNRTGNAIEGITVFDQLDWRLEITDIIVNDFNASGFDNSIGTNLIEIGDLTIPTGITTLEYEVKLKEGYYCPNKKLGNQAVLKNLPASLGFGAELVSDNPATGAENDITYIDIIRNWEFKVGKLNKSNIKTCGVIDEDVELVHHISEGIYWEYSEDNENWVQFQGSDFEDYTIHIMSQNTTQDTKKDFYRAMVYCRCDTQYVDLNTQILPIPEIQLSNEQSICAGDSVDSGSGYVSYQWSSGETSQKIVPATSGDYSVTVTNEQSCPNSSSSKIIVHEYPSVDIPQPERFCQGESTEIGIASENDQTYLWSTGSETSTIRITAAGSYMLTVTQYGCTAADTVEVLTYQLPYAPELVSSNQICYDDSLPILEASGLNLSWYEDPGLNTLINQGNEFQLSNYKNGFLAEDASFIFYLQSEDGNCQSNVSEVKFHRNGRQTEITILTDTLEVCQGTSAVDVEVFGTLDTVIWKLDRAEFNRKQPNDAKNAWLDFNQAGTASVTATTFDDQNCEYENSLDIIVRPLPKAELLVNMYEEEATIKNISNNSSETAYYWELPGFSGMEFTNSLDTTMLLQYGEYQAYLKAVNQFNCENETSETFRVHVPFELYIPNAFAPDESTEGINQFKVVSLYLDQFEVTIYDNWGNTLWRSEALDEKGMPLEGWNGKFEGQSMPAGVYRWKINARFMNQSEWKGIKKASGKYTKFGNVVLLR